MESILASNLPDKMTFLACTLGTVPGSAPFVPA